MQRLDIGYVQFVAAVQLDSKAELVWWETFAKLISASPVVDSEDAERRALWIEMTQDVIPDFTSDLFSDRIDINIEYVSDPEGSVTTYCQIYPTNNRGSFDDLNSVLVLLRLFFVVFNDATRLTVFPWSHIARKDQLPRATQVIMPPRADEAFLEGGIAWAAATEAGLISTRDLAVMTDTAWSSNRSPRELFGMEPIREEEPRRDSHADDPFGEETKKS